MPLKTKLQERVLRFDGVSEIEPGQLSRFLLLGVSPSQLRVTEENEEIQLLNEQVDTADMVKVLCEEPINVDLTWQLPKEYAQLDLAEYLMNAFFNQELQDRLKYTQTQTDIAIVRIANELEQIEIRHMSQFMRTIIFILDEFKRNNIVWGVGRGSSCASYLLFLIGLHVVDCVIFEVPMEEFFHE